MLGGERPEALPQPVFYLVSLKTQSGRTWTLLEARSLAEQKKDRVEDRCLCFSSISKRSNKDLRSA